MATLIQDYWSAGKVKLRAISHDMFDGLRGHEYIEARCLNKKVQKINRSDDVQVLQMVGNWNKQQ